MNNDADKQIAFEMTKAIIEARKQHSATSPAQYDKVVHPEYWADLYHQCLVVVIDKPEKAMRIDSNILGRI